MRFGAGAALTGVMAGKAMGPLRKLARCVEPGDECDPTLPTEPAPNGIEQTWTQNRRWYPINDPSGVRSDLLLAQTAGWPLFHRPPPCKLQFALNRIPEHPRDVDLVKTAEFLNPRRRGHIDFGQIVTDYVDADEDLALFA